MSWIEFKSAHELLMNLNFAFLESMNEFEFRFFKVNEFEFIYKKKRMDLTSYY